MLLLCVYHDDDISLLTMYVCTKIDIFKKRTKSEKE